MSLFVITLNITIASIASLICFLGWKTLKSIRHLNMGKSFWVPILVSGFSFLIGSIITIFNEMGFMLATISNEIIQFTQLLGLCSLSIGIYCYSKEIRKNLSEKILISEAISAQNDDTEVEVIPASTIDNVNSISNGLRLKAVSGCNHQLGYLRTFPINASLPEECLDCDKVMKCKHY